MLAPESRAHAARTLYGILVKSGIWAFCVAVGKLLSMALPLRNESGLFLFFPYYHVGGAERVHADIAACFSHDQPWIIFTRRSKDASYRSLFPETARIFSLWPLGFLFPLSLGLAAGFVNRHDGAMVFGGNSPFFYRLLPYLESHVRKVDITHAFDGLEELSLSVAKLLDARVVITEQTRTDLERQYFENGLDAHLIKRVHYIPNRVSVPPSPVAKNYDRTLHVIYVGRGTPEKRVHLVGRVAELCRNDGVDVKFTLVGDMGDALGSECREYCDCIGVLTDPLKMQRLYQDAHILLLVSSREGFPLVIMEAMANGVVPISTNVGGIGQHLDNGHNGILIDELTEDAITLSIRQAMESLSDRERLQQMSQAAYAYARQHFDNPDFCKCYKEVICGVNQFSQKTV